MRTKFIVLFAIGIVSFLLLTFIVMQFTDEMNWAPFDFLAAGTLLFVVGFAYEVLARRFQTRTNRLAIGAALTALLLLVWAQLAVGIL